MRNKTYRAHVAPLFLLLGSIVSCVTELRPNPVPDVPAWCGAGAPASPIPEGEVPPWCGAESPANPAPESKAHLYCPGYHDTKTFVDALMAGAVLPGELSPCLPLDVNASLSDAIMNGKRDSAIRQLNTFGWQMFIALNWPVEPRGGHLLFAPSLEGQGEPRWYGWNTTTCGDTLDTSIKISSKHFDHYLWDQHGKPVGFEIVMNQPVYNIINKYQLYTPEGRQQNSDAEFGWTDVNNGCFGSTIIKLAWKELDEQDQADRFFRRVASTPDNPTPREFGLVGMHIAYKLSYLIPRWVWITFEHIDNVDDRYEPACAPPAPPPRAEPLFYDKQCKPADCPLNNPASKNPRLGPEGRATQIERKIAIEPETVDFNCNIRALLHDRAPGSPAQYYKLVAAQAALKYASGDMQFVPPNAMNTMLETYEQDSGGGCAQCHQGAPQDFVWMLSSRLRTNR
ncbi:hypothetical protein WMF38_25940 [Sorangium sp. So ce118]